MVSAACPMASRYSRYTTQLRFLISWKVAREEPANRTTNMSFLGLQEIIRVNDCPKKKKRSSKSRSNLERVVAVDGLCNASASLPVLLGFERAQHNNNKKKNSRLARAFYDLSIFLFFFFVVFSFLYSLPSIQTTQRLLASVVVVVVVVVVPVSLFEICTQP